jgi:L-iditol 2-dehydrogenase
MSRWISNLKFQISNFLSASVLLCLWAGSSFAGTLSGTVRNGTTGKPAAGIDVILIQLQGGMQPVASGKTDSQGQFKFDNAGVGAAPMLVRAVYRGVNDVRVEAVPVPAVGRGELLVRVHTCGICGTDLKKIATGSHSAPRIFGHETSGVVAATGAGVTSLSPGDRVVVFHHIPCRECFYCRHKTFAQCETYKKVGCTAGFEPAGGGFAEYVRVMDWIVRHGTVRIPDEVSFEQACFVEPVNTCMKGIENLQLASGETVLVIGQGPIGIILGVLAKRAGVRVITSDLYIQRLKISKLFGLQNPIDASRTDTIKAVREQTEGRGADAAIVAVGANGLIRNAMDAVRPGGRVLLFAQTARGEATIDPAAVCMDEKTLLGSYSASVELQEASVRFVMNREMDLEQLISHRFPLSRSAEALNLAAHPQPDSMKIVVQPGSGWGGN